MTDVLWSMLDAAMIISFIVASIVFIHWLGRDKMEEEIGDPIGDCEFFDIYRSTTGPKRVTYLYEFINKKSYDLIGEIKWYGAWRQYCFYPTPGSIWSKGCLDEVTAFMEKIKDERVPKELISG